MAKPLDVESCSGEALVGALLASRRSDTVDAAVAAEIAAGLLCDLGGFSGLSRASIDEIEEQLAAAPRLRLPARACAQRIGAAFELGRRAATDVVPPRSIASSADVAKWAAGRLSGLEHEELWLLALDGRGHLRAIRCVARGGLHGLGVRVADPLRLALRAAASGFVLVHNHPSGDPTPSAEDVAFTRRLAAAAVVVGMPLLDHVVVAREGFTSVSFADEALPLASGGAAA